MLNRGKEMKKAFMFLLLILYSGITAGLETFTTGDTLLTNCEYDNPVGCMAFIAGVSDASQEKTYEGYRYCMPDNVTLGQLVNIVTRHLNIRRPLRTEHQGVADHRGPGAPPEPVGRRDRQDDCNGQGRRQPRGCPADRQRTPGKKPVGCRQTTLGAGAEQGWQTLV